MYTAEDVKEILYFYSPNCVQCREATESLKILDNKFNVRYINGDKNPEISRKYNIEFYPTVIVLDNENNKLEHFSGVKKIINYVKKIFIH